MITITTTSELDFELVKESLSNHGFEFKTEVKRRWLFGTYYRIEVAFSPKIPFLQHLLNVAIKEEDYWAADSIQRMINLKK